MKKCDALSPTGSAKLRLQLEWGSIGDALHLQPLTLLSCLDFFLILALYTKMSKKFGSFEIISLILLAT